MASAFYLRKRDIINADIRKPISIRQSHVKDTAQQEHLSPVDYNLLFESERIEDTPLEILTIGELNIPSGLIVTDDPLIITSAEGFTKSVMPGKYPVRLVIAKTKKSGVRVAIAQLQFSQEKAAKWVLALKKEDNVSNLKKDEFLGFAVDAGLACFADKTAAEEYLKFGDQFYKQHPNGNLYTDLLEAGFEKSAKRKKDGGIWMDFKIPGTNNNVMMFEAGYGDGVYPSYWGISKDGKILSLVIDFQVLLN